MGDYTRLDGIEAVVRLRVYDYDMATSSWATKLPNYRYRRASVCADQPSCILEVSSNGGDRHKGERVLTVVREIPIAEQEYDDFIISLYSAIVPPPELPKDIIPAVIVSHPYDSRSCPISCLSWHGENREVRENERQIWTVWAAWSRDCVNYACRVLDW